MSTGRKWSLRAMLVTAICATGLLFSTAAHASLQDGGSWSTVGSSTWHP
jgi:hypothetical protein